MVQEQYVSFETAKLLKEKGFNQYTPIVYDEDGNYMPDGVFDDLGGTYKTFIPMPTQALVMRWLRERNIDIIPFHEIFDDDVYWCRVEKKYGNLLHTEIQQDPIYKTYEDAVEDAIQYCLKVLV